MQAQDYLYNNLISLKLTCSLEEETKKVGSQPDHIVIRAFVYNPGVFMDLCQGHWPNA